MKTKIQPFSKKQIIDYQDKTAENFWLLPDDTFSIKPTDEYQNKFTYLLKNTQNAVICIQTPELNDPELKKALEQSVRQNNRIYLLTNPKPDFLKDLCGTILMRYGINLTGSFILVNPVNNKESEGIFFNAPLTQTCLMNRLYECLDLSKDQVQTLYHFFLYNFWYRAGHEILEDFNTPQAINKENIPVFIPEPTQTFVDSAYILHEVQKLKEKAQIITPFINPTHHIFDFHSYKNCTFKTSFTAINPEYVLNLSQGQNTIQANPNTQIVSNIILSQDKSYLLSCDITSDEEDLIFALPLNALQKSKIEKKYSELAFAFATFVKSSTRKEVQGRKIAFLGKESQTIRIEPISTKDLGEVYPDKDKLVEKAVFEAYVPPLNDDGSSCKIEYIWKTTPFYTPDNARIHTLYHTWETHSQKLENYSKTIIQQIEKTKEKQDKTITGKISSLWNRLRRTVLSKEQKFESKTNQINTILAQKEKLPFYDVSERNKIIRELNEIASEIHADCQEIENEVQKTEIEEEIDQLKTELEIKQAQFRDWDNEQQKIIQQKEKEKQGTINAKNHEIEAMKKAFNEWDKQEQENIAKQEQDKTQKLNQFLENHQAKDLNKFKNDLQQKAGKKNREKNPHEAEEANKIMTELRNIEAINPKVTYEQEKKQKQQEIISMENELRELQKINTKGNYEQEKKKKQDETDNLEAQIQKKQKELENVGKITETKTNTNTSGLDEMLNVTVQNDTHKNISSFVIPQDLKALPKVGELYLGSGKTFLAIEYWEDYAFAREEAERFEAILCAKKP